MTIALGASDHRHEHRLPPMSSSIWVTAWGAWVPSMDAQEVSRRVNLEGYQTRPQGNTVQFRQDKNNMPSAEAVAARVKHHRLELWNEHLKRLSTEPEEDNA